MPFSRSTQLSKLPPFPLWRHLARRSIISWKCSACFISWRSVPSAPSLPLWNAFRAEHDRDARQPAVGAARELGPAEDALAVDEAALTLAAQGGHEVQARLDVLLALAGGTDGVDVVLADAGDVAQAVRLGESGDLGIERPHVARAVLRPLLGSGIGPRSRTISLASDPRWISRPIARLPIALRRSIGRGLVGVAVRVPASRWTRVIRSSAYWDLNVRARARRRRSRRRAAA